MREGVEKNPTEIKEWSDTEVASGLTPTSQQLGQLSAATSRGGGATGKRNPTQTTPCP